MTEATIRVVTVRTMDDVTVDVTQAPTPGPAEVMIRPAAVGVCGSDMHAAMGTHPFIDRPYHPGHEVVGTVEAVGSQVTSPTPGERVVVEPNLPCGRCAQCRAGRYNICGTLAVFGCQTPGGMADLFTIAADRVHVLPPSMTFAQAAFIEPLATPVHAVRKAGELTGRRVLVIGAGPIGALVLIAAIAAGAGQVVVSDLQETKRARALRLGAGGVVDGADPSVAERIRDQLGGEADVVFDCVSRESSLALAVDVLTKGGQIVVIGVGLPGGTPVRVDLIQDRELRIEGALMYVARDYAAAIELIAAGKVPVDDLITAVYPLDRAAEAFRASLDPEQMKILVSLVPEAELHGGQG